MNFGLYDELRIDQMKTYNNAFDFIENNKIDTKINNDNKILSTLLLPPKRNNKRLRGRMGKGNFMAEIELLNISIEKNMAKYKEMRDNILQFTLPVTPLKTLASYFSVKTIEYLLFLGCIRFWQLYKREYILTSNDKKELIDLYEFGCHYLERSEEEAINKPNFYILIVIVKDILSYSNKSDLDKLLNLIKIKFEPIRYNKLNSIINKVVSQRQIDNIRMKRHDYKSNKNIQDNIESNDNNNIISKLEDLTIDDTNDDKSTANKLEQKKMDNISRKRLYSEIVSFDENSKEAEDESDKDLACVFKRPKVKGAGEVNNIIIHGSLSNKEHLGFTRYAAEADNIAKKYNVQLDFIVKLPKSGINIMSIRKDNADTWYNCFPYEVHAINEAIERTHKKSIHDSLRDMFIDNNNDLDKYNWLIMTKDPISSSSAKALLGEVNKNMYFKFISNHALYDSMNIDIGTLLDMKITPDIFVAEFSILLRYNNTAKCTNIAYMKFNNSRKCRTIIDSLDTKINNKSLGVYYTNEAGLETSYIPKHPLKWPDNKLSILTDKKIHDDYIIQYKLNGIHIIILVDTHKSDNMDSVSCYSRVGHRLPVPKFIYEFITVSDIYLTRPYILQFEAFSTEDPTSRINNMVNKQDDSLRYYWFNYTGLHSEQINQPYHYRYNKIMKILKDICIFIYKQDSRGDDDAYTEPVYMKHTNGVYAPHKVSELHPLIEPHPEFDSLWGSEVMDVIEGIVIRGKKESHTETSKLYKYKWIEEVSGTILKLTTGQSNSQLIATVRCVVDNITIEQDILVAVSEARKKIIIKMLSENKYKLNTNEYFPIRYFSVDKYSKVLVNPVLRL